jgi:hypothetical protein
MRCAAQFAVDFVLVDMWQELIDQKVGPLEVQDIVGGQKWGRRFCQKSRRRSICKLWLDSRLCSRHCCAPKGIRTLKRGDRGPEVALLRRMLNLKRRPAPSIPEGNIFQHPYAVGTAADFGPQTHDAIVAFQYGQNRSKPTRSGRWAERSLSLRVCRLSTAS